MNRTYRQTPFSGWKNKNQTHFSKPGKDQFIRAGWLIDGRGGPVKTDVVLCVRDGRIDQIHSYRSPMDGALDYSKATLLPVLMDAHVHLALAGTRNAQIRQAQLTQSSSEAQAAIARHLEHHWQSGVGAVRDAGDRHGEVLRFKGQAGSESNLPPVRVAATCWAWHAAGRYGRMIGQAPPPRISLAQAVAALMEDIDHIKIIQSGLNSVDRFGRQTEPQFSDSQLRQTIDMAHAANRPVMVHANGEVPVRLAVEAGCNSIEHGYFMGTENVRRLAESGTVWVPTAVPMAALARDPGLSADQRQVADRTLADQLEQIALAHRSGVTMAVGTDAGTQGVDHGSAVRQEMALLMSAGLSLTQVIRCATLNTARLMGLEQRGALLPGWRADFIAVPGSPAELPESLSAIQAICLGGRWWQNDLSGGFEPN